jgi:hypothetical protein
VGIDARIDWAVPSFSSTVCSLAIETHSTFSFSPISSSSIHFHVACFFGLRYRKKRV